VTLRSCRCAGALAVLALAAAPAAADVAADRAALQRLEGRAKVFYDVVARGEREKAAGEWSGLAADLEAFADRLEDDLGRMKDEVTERDGDLEELYRSPRWREPEIMSLVATYHLAWVRYQARSSPAIRERRRRSSRRRSRASRSSCS
jgi:hypothetical protein